MKKLFLYIVIFLILGTTIFYFFKTNNIKIKSKGKKETTYNYIINTEGKKYIYLFLGDIEKEKFKLYKTFIYKTPTLISQIKQTIEQLISFKTNEEYLSFIPIGTTLRETFLDFNNICYVDFSEDIILNHKGGTTGEYFTIYSIVNTICYNFPQVKGVKILIDGKEEETLAGHIDISNILQPDESIKEIKE